MIKDFLMSPLPKSLGTVKLVFTRHRGGFANLNCKYRLYDETQKIFFLNSKKKVTCQTPYHLISCAFEAFDNTSVSYCGKLRADHSKHHYTVFDDGGSIKKIPTLLPQYSRREMCAVVHKKHTEKSVYTKTFDCILPYIDDNGVQRCPQPINQHARLMDGYETGTENIVLQTVEAHWDKRKDRFTIDFSKRVKKKSIKNFQLRLKSGVPLDPDESDVFMEFGKMSKDTFAINVRWPFSLLAAFGVAVSACEAPSLG